MSIETLLEYHSEIWETESKNGLNGIRERVNESIHSNYLSGKMPDSIVPEYEGGLEQSDIRPVPYRDEVKAPVKILEKERKGLYLEKNKYKEHKHIVLLSGGHSSALVAIEAERRFGKKNIILLHNGLGDMEDSDIKRFGLAISDFIGIPITYANSEYVSEETGKILDQFDISVERKAWSNPLTGEAICTYHLKTKPFYAFLAENFPEGNCTIYYGYDHNELRRICKREDMFESTPWNMDAPLALWGMDPNTAMDLFGQRTLISVYNDFRIKYDFNKARRLMPEDQRHKLTLIAFLEAITPSQREENGFHRTIFNSEEIGIKRPDIYATREHANCDGCTKGGLKHWYWTYCLRYDTAFCKGRDSETTLNKYRATKELKPISILKKSTGDDKFLPLSELEPIFEKMKCAGINPSEHSNEFSKYWKTFKNAPDVDEESKPCLCFL